MNCWWRPGTNRGIKTMPYGKQRRDRGGMWYTPVSGIWQTVWMERVPDDYIRELHFFTEGNTVNLELVGPKTGMLCLKTPEGEMQVPIREGKAALTLSNPRPWSPEDPLLYEAVTRRGRTGWRATLHSGPWTSKP